MSVGLQVPLWKNIETLEPVSITQQHPLTSRGKNSDHGLVVGVANACMHVPWYGPWWMVVVPPSGGCACSWGFYLTFYPSYIEDTFLIPEPPAAHYLMSNVWRDQVRNHGIYTGSVTCQYFAAVGAYSILCRAHFLLCCHYLYLIQDTTLNTKRETLLEINFNFK